MVPEAMKEARGAQVVDPLALDTRWNGCRIVGALVHRLVLPNAYEAALASVSSWRQRKAQSYRFRRDRCTSLLAGLLLDKLLRERGLRERDRSYVAGEQGKPAFSDCSELHFNVAHSGDMAVVALSAHPVGIDVESLSDFPYEVAEPYAWTEMESVGKLLGCGIGTFVDGAGYRRPEGVVVKHIMLDGYLVCVARR